MIFWIAAAALAAAVTYVVTRPLAGARDDAAPIDAQAADIAVYRDQLKEIEADVARGALSVDEAQSARNEVSRRLLRRSSGDDAGIAPSMSASSALPRRFFAAVSVGLPLASLALYLSFGSPGLPGQPLSARLQSPLDPGRGNDLVARVEAALRANPDDGKGWDVIAPVYMAQARFSDAANAYASAMRLLGESANRLQGFADARIRAENGIVAEDARLALEKVRKLEPNRPEPRIWLALAREQDGDIKTAIAEYRAVLAESAADAPWRRMLEARIAGLDATENPGDASDRKPADVAAFESMTPEQRAAKIDEMVSGLAAKLKASPDDLAGWQRLIRAYTALGRRDDAVKAGADARAGLSGNEDNVRRLDAWMKELGLSG